MKDGCPLCAEGDGRIHGCVSPRLKPPADKPAPRLGPNHKDGTWLQVLINGSPATKKQTQDLYTAVRQMALVEAVMIAEKAGCQVCAKAITRKRKSEARKAGYPSFAD